MKWSNLKLNKCPKCNRDFIKGLETQIMQNGGKLFLHPCGFKITEKRYKEIVTSQVTRDIDREYEEGGEDEIE